MHSTEVPELLAPAGSPDALIAAVSAGADAVYLGGDLYGARRNAVNFGKSEMEWALRYCHTRGVRVYVTLNILLSDAELQGAVQYAYWLYEQGVDAVIVQDVGLADILHTHIPALVLHASTQMTILSKEGLGWVHALGCSRVVLPRELTIQEISALYAGSDDRYPAPEVFVHGALCYAYSGQCLLSSLIGGRSGNRGSCAQPCRREYTLLCGAADVWGLPAPNTLTAVKKQYLLSPRDLCVYPHISEIIKSPAVSLKIEGRMKSPEYVATVVSVYRKALDEAKSGAFVPTEADILTLNAAFNREFTGGYLLDKKSGTVMGPEAPGNRGVHIGTVSSYNPRKKLAEISLNGVYSPVVGDGLSFSGNGDGFSGGTVLRKTPDIRNRKCQVHVPMHVRSGDAVYLTKSGRDALAADELIRNKGSRMVPIHLSLKMEDNVPVMNGTAFLRTGEISVTFKADFAFSLAKNRPVAAETVTDLLSRTGDTPYFIESFSSDYSGGLFAPIGEITRFRREFFGALEEAIVRSFVPGKIEFNAIPDGSVCNAARESGTTSPSHLPLHDVEISVYASDCDTVRGALEGGCRKIYFEPQGRPGDGRVWNAAETKDWLMSEISAASALCAEYGADIIWKWPRITRQHFLDAACCILPSLQKSGVRGVMVENIGALAALRGVDSAISIYGGTGLNIFNSHSAAICGRDCVSVTLSPELSLSSIQVLVSELLSDERTGTIPECIIHGSAELVVSEDCVIATAAGTCPGCRGLAGTGNWFGLKDAKGHVFPATIDRECRTHIWNSRETCMIDHLHSLLDAGIRSVAIDCRIRNGRYAHAVVRAYMSAFELLSAGTGMNDKDIQALKDEIQQIASGGITTGHFLKGVIEKEKKIFSV
ncbi:U32 family peptidase [Methanogenium organophilum]|uniref:U32 family peptidase n=1 Tax=Methanogenium organophilum TaxID=2199 RepID=A0A9X9S4E5_METOG|nr:U32 family peptidase [Methanogenium organophilum]WAI01326.1 U32 family peptidase [Methanogenium organophilum]